MFASLSTPAGPQQSSPNDATIITNKFEHSKNSQLKNIVTSGQKKEKHLPHLVPFHYHSSAICNSKPIVNCLYQDEHGDFDR